MNITSPELSFLSFNPEIQQDCNTDIELALPVCDTLAVKAQILVDTETDTLTTDKLYVAICDDSCNVLLDENIEVQPICSKYKFYTTFEEFEVPVSNEYNLCNTANEEPTTVFSLDSNPFDLVTSSDLAFDVLTSPIGYQLQIYCEGKIYIIEWGLTSGVNYDYTITDSIYFVKVKLGTGLAMKLNLRNFFTQVFDVNHSTTSSLASDTITIANIPASTYINNYLFADNVTTVTASTYIGQYFYWNANQINYTSIGTALAPLFSFETSLTSANSYNFKYYYTGIYNDMVGTVTIDDGINPPTVENVSFDSYDGTLDIPFTAAATGTHTVTIEITDFAGHKNGLSIQKIEQYNTLFYNVTNNISANVPVGVYSRDELIALISSLLGFTFDCEFISCCEVPAIEFEITLPDDDTIYNFKLSTYWQKGYIDYPETSIDTIASNCFTYGILNASKEVIACSNLFRKETDCCYISRIEYGNNEDAFGFSYPTGITNMVNMPFFLSSPNYQVKEEVYRQTDGTYKRITADIEKEYEVETDYMSEFMHDKLIVALKHDTVIVTSNRLNFESQVSQQGDYKIDWNSKIDFSAMAGFKLRKYFNGKNNNCGTNCD